MSTNKPDNIQKAVTILKSAVMFDPENIRLEKNMAHCFLMQEDKSRALSLYHKYKHRTVVREKKTSLWSEVIVDDLHVLGYSSKLSKQEMLWFTDNISSLSPDASSYETLRSDLDALKGKHKAKEIDEQQFLEGLQELLSRIRTISDRDVFNLYEHLIYLMTSSSISDNDKFVLSQQLLSVAQQAARKGLISQRELAGEILTVTWYALNGQAEELETAVKLSDEANKLAPDYLQIKNKLRSCIGSSWQRERSTCRL